MIKRGHREVTEETFRMRKHRLMRDAREAREVWEKKIAEIEAVLESKRNKNSCLPVTAKCGSLPIMGA
jgi:hypothetical protein